MPAEWEPHDRCYMAWPCNPQTWFGYDKEAKASYAEVAQAIARFEPVGMLTPPELLGEARAALGPGIDLVPMELDDSWVRDNGPFFVRSPEGEVAIVQFGFNGWGGRFTPYARDAQVPALLVKSLGLPLYRAPMIAEGGAICVDGEGTLLTTESCLLNPNRNGGRSRGEVEAVLRSYLGARRVLWLSQGMHGSVVDGHIDGIAAFIGPGKVLAAVARDPSDANHAILRENLERLGSMTDWKGRSLEVIQIPLPTRRQLAGLRVAATYINFYIANGGVVAPTFGDPADGEALAILANAFPDREVVGVRSEYIGIGGGVIHCITQQSPRGRPPRTPPSNP